MLNRTMKGLTNWVVGAGPFVHQMADQIFIELINRMVTWDPI